MTFRADVRHAGEIAILDLTGELNRAADAALAVAHDQAVADRPRALVLNFEHVDYINSTGIALIVTVLAGARQEGREVRVIGLTDHYRHIFEITRLSDFLMFYDDETAALAGIAPAGA